MKNVKEILDSIASTSSRNKKEGILDACRNNELLLEVLQFVYDDFIITSIAKNKIGKKIKTNFEGVIIPKDFRGLREYLLNNNSGRDKDIYVVQQYIARQDEELRELYEKMVTKTLKIGITSKTLCKVYGDDFIRRFDVMLAQKYEEKLVKGKKFIITTKLDGNRVVAIHDNNQTLFFTRQGKLIEGLVELEEEFKKLPRGYVYDGELILNNTNGLGSKELFQATQKVVRKKGAKKGLEFHTFDMLKIEEFYKGICNFECINRKAMLETIIHSCDSNLIKNVKVLYYGDDISVIPTLLQKVEEMGLEGLMINISNSPYECKRTNNLLKVKSMHTMDLEIVDMIEGDGEFEGTLGALVVDFKGYKVGVGSGFTHEDREKFWSNKGKYIGRVVEVQYFEQTKNKDGDISLRFPVFKMIREIGKEVSYH